MDNDALFSLLNSPSLLRYIGDQRELVSTIPYPQELVVASSENPVFPSNQVALAPEVSVYTPPVTRSNVPFSPDRTTVTRFGQRYHVEKESAEAAPVVHIPEAGQPPLSIGTDDQEYVQFLLTVINNAGDVQPEERDEDPSYRVPRNANPRDDFVAHVSDREKYNLIADLESDPIPGLALELKQMETEPPIITRSAKRQRTSDVFTPANQASSSPTFHMELDSPSTSGATQCRPKTRTSGTVNAQPVFTQKELPLLPSTTLSESVSSRTRQSLAKSPAKCTPSTMAFKTPLPVQLTSPRPRTRSSLPPTDDNAEAYSPAEPQSRPTVSAKKSKGTEERFRILGEKIRNVLKYQNFSTDQKQMVVQLLEFAMEKFADEDCLVLVDYVLRVVALVCGHVVVAQVSPVFEKVRALHSGYAHLVVGLLLYDKSPAVLQLAPILYGKTALLKSVREQLMNAANSDSSTEVIQTFYAAFAANDRPYQRKSALLQSDAALWLGVTGEEGLIDPTVLEYLPEEIIHNPEERMAEYLAAEIPPNKAPPKEILPSVQPVSVPFPSISSVDVSQFLDGVLNDSNSFPNVYLPNDPPAAAPLNYNPLSAHNQTPASPFNFTGQAPVSPQIVGPQNSIVPRRVPLVSAPFTESPAKIHRKRMELSSGYINENDGFMQ